MSRYSPKQVTLLCAAKTVEDHKTVTNRPTADFAHRQTLTVSCALHKGHASIIQLYLRCLNVAITLTGAQEFPRQTVSIQCQCCDNYRMRVVDYNYDYWQLFMSNYDYNYQLYQNDNYHNKKRRLLPILLHFTSTILQ